MSRKKRQCPYCKGKTGIKVSYTINGFGHEDRDFNGNVIDSNRETYDTNDYITCLDCGKDLDKFDTILDI